MSAELSAERKQTLSASVAWRAQLDALLQKQESERRDLEDARKLKEDVLSARELGLTRVFVMRNLNNSVQRLIKLASGVDDKDEIPVGQFNAPTIKVDKYFEAADKLEDTRPGQFIKNMFESMVKGMFVQSKKHSNIIRLCSAHIVDVPKYYKFMGQLAIRDEDDRALNSFDIDFEAPISGHDGIRINFHNNVYSTNPLEKQFGELMLSEKAIVVSTLFSATYEAVTDALKEH